MEIVVLNEEVSDVLLCKLPPKLKDQGSFTIRASSKPKVKVNELIIQADFLVLEMKDAPTPGRDFPLILGRPFMRMAMTMINVYKVILKMSMNEETVKFNVLDAFKFPNDDRACFSIYIMDNLVQEVMETLQGETPLEKVLIHGLKILEDASNLLCDLWCDPWSHSSQYNEQKLVSSGSSEFLNSP
ncbi:hypothetical protein LWI28_003428 [Acer negundo]|uniref:Uncharacterized protein n=1 Tax=Acer negundo TaxID=4023 RepID=A0AAD5J870_ACENE|nr:hypothetical protein LWI28_018630 [Acer negundo]KAI9188633.1 hypothetical protein LWI28_003428 [Acer negundo]